MTIDLLYGRIRQALAGRSPDVVLRSEYAFSYSVVHTQVSLRLRLIATLINCGVNHKKLIYRIPVLNVLAQRIYWNIRNRYFNEMEDSK